MNENHTSKFMTKKKTNKILRDFTEKGLSLKEEENFVHEIKEYGIENNYTTQSINYPKLKHFIRRFITFQAFSDDSSIPLHVVFEDERCVNNYFFQYLRDDFINHTKRSTVFLNIRRIKLNSLITCLVALLAGITEILILKNTMLWLIVLSQFINLFVFSFPLQPLLYYFWYSIKRKLRLEKIYGKSN
ncbi:hypothetical protein NEF87_000367 [Candidatus Lokiarchaeum ossiferum]|uniref:Uncharacterized protein n=1 Tax=Candidatus Lokiarchaeum ossiferum TaxID=2951803 RepID=A0ABY6HMG7_9ARCH|nr:hypothetical protein NEF87_000367 [Candidatus Lokiarchaeum sp. B-35]